MARTHRMAAAAIAVLVMQAGCGSAGDAPPASGPSSDSSSPIRMVDRGFDRKEVSRKISAPWIPPATCPAYQAKKVPATELGNRSFLDGFGRCGELPFFADGALRVALPDGRIVDLDKGATSFTLSPDGSRLLAFHREFDGQDTLIRLFDLTTLAAIGEALLSPDVLWTGSDPSRGRWRFLPGEGMPLVVCVDGRISTLEAEGLESWSPDVVDCGSLVFAAEKPVFAFSGEGGRLQIADFAENALRTVPAIEYQWGSESEDGKERRQDLLAFSPDGQILLHQSAIRSMEDYGLHRETESSIVDAVGGKVIARLPFDTTPRAINDRGFADRRPFFADGEHLLVIPTAEGSLVLGQDLGLVVLHDIEVLVASGEHLIALTKSGDEANPGIALLDASGKEVRRLADDVNVLRIDASPSRDRLAVTLRTGDCLEWVDTASGGYCQLPRYDLVLLDPDGEPSTVATGWFVSARWIDDQALVIGKRDPGSTQIHRFLLDGDGPLLPLEGEAGALSRVGSLFVERRILDTRVGYEHMQLVVLDPATGESRLLGEGRSIHSHVSRDGTAIAWESLPLGDRFSWTWTAWISSAQLP